jgi:hypothetical protein
MTSWHPQRGVYLYRPRLGPGDHPLHAQDPEFPWLAVPLFGLGFALFFAGLALLGIEPQLWEGLFVAAGVALLVGGSALLVKRFL